jgi:hypothetical protein
MTDNLPFSGQIVVLFLYLEEDTAYPEGAAQFFR